MQSSQLDSTKIARRLDFSPVSLERHIIPCTRDDSSHFAKIIQNTRDDSSHFAKIFQNTQDARRSNENLTIFDNVGVSKLTPQIVQVMKEKNIFIPPTPSHLGTIPPEVTTPSQAVATPSKEGASSEGAPSAPAQSKYKKNYCLGIAYIPVIGILSSVTAQCILSGRLKKTTESEAIIKLITRVNQFKVASIVRSLLTLASVIAVLAFGIITGGLTLGLGLGLLATTCILGLGSITFHSIQFHSNKNEINSLQSQKKSPVEPTLSK